MSSKFEMLESVERDFIDSTFPVLGVDLGSGKVRAIIKLPDGSGGWLEPIKIEAKCNLAEGLSPRQKNPVILPSNLDRGVEFAWRVGNLCKRYNISSHRRIAVGTHALRTVCEKNPKLGQQYIDRFTEAFGFPCLVATGREEAALVGLTGYLDSLRNKLSFERLTVGNIGGGSSQFCTIVLTNDPSNPVRIENLVSIPHGALTLKTDCGDNLKKAESLYFKELAESYPHPDTSISLALGGGWRAGREAMCQGLGYHIHGKNIIKETIARVKRLSPAEFSECGKKCSDRAQYMPINMAAFNAFIDHTAPKDLYFGKTTMCETLVEILAQNCEKILIAVPPDLERLFVPSAPLQALRA